jgi:hypothetical protein
MRHGRVAEGWRLLHRIAADHPEAACCAVGAMVAGLGPVSAPMTGREVLETLWRLPPPEGWLRGGGPTVSHSRHATRLEYRRERPLRSRAAFAFRMRRHGQGVTGGEAELAPGQARSVARGACRSGARFARPWQRLPPSPCPWGGQEKHS